MRESGTRQGAAVTIRHEQTADSQRRRGSDIAFDRRRAVDYVLRPAAGWSRFSQGGWPRGASATRKFAVSSGQNIIVVDGVPETEQVLRAVLEPRGHQVERVRAFELDAAASDRHVLVLHDDGSQEARRTRHGETPRVVIGSMTTEETSSDSSERQLSHPFHYAELIRAVESLLAEGAPRRSAA